MTPSALTPAARGTTKKPRPDAPSPPSAARGSGHRVRRPVAPTAPRRVSGPVAGAAASGVIAVPAPGRTRPRERVAPPPKRTSPARPRAPRSRRAPLSTAWAPSRLRTGAYLRALPDNVLLDRIIRGRVWIPLLGMLLAGIVFMQVEVLKLNAGIGRSLERGSALQAQNELLRANVSQLSDQQRIERIAAQMGLVMPGPDQLRFVRPGAGSAQRAVGSIHAPDATDFVAQLPAPGGATSTAATGSTSTADAAGTSATAGTLGTTASPTTEAPTTAAGTTEAPTAAAGTSQAPTAASPATPSGTTDAGTASSPGATTPQSAPTVPAAPTTSAGATDQSGSSSSGGAGATPVGG